MATAEFTASKQYAAFAEQASRDSLLDIETLFRAASMSEAIHSANHIKALQKIDNIKFLPTIADYKMTASTIENLSIAINNETIEFSSAYPKCIKEAEGIEDALITFNFAQDAEIAHSKIFAEALAKLNNGEKSSSKYCICKRCGLLFIFNDAPNNCQLCNTSKADFITIQAK